MKKALLAAEVLALRQTLKKIHEWTTAWKRQDSDRLLKAIHHETKKHIEEP